MKSSTLSEACRRSQRSSVELAMIRYDELRKRLTTPEHNVARLLTAHNESRTRQCIDALAA